MESNFYTDEFEQLLKEKADQFRMYPSRRVWHSIYNNLHPSRRWPSAAMSIFLIITLLLTGYLNTSDNSITNQFANTNDTQTSTDFYSNTSKKAKAQKTAFTNTKQHQLPNSGSEYVAKAFITDQSELSVYTDVKNVDPNTVNEVAQNIQELETNTTEDKTSINTNSDIIQAIDTYIKANHIFTDIANSNKKIKVKSSVPSFGNTGQEEITDENELKKTGAEKITTTVNSSRPDKPVNDNENSIANKNLNLNSKSLSAEEKAWIENYALQNKSGTNKWKGKLAIEFYVTPAVNYRKLTTNSKGSVSAFANSDINQSISQRPGFGFESGADFSYSFAKNLRFKAGLQFNYTNYNIDADQTNHPILTSILLNDPYGNSYSAFRTSTISNAYNSSALQPIILHNRTYQISLPVGLAYKLSSTNNVEWFAGASVQPTYVFGGKAHLISTDLKSYVSDPSSISNWNLNLGFETYMAYKVGSYHLQIGPQVRYQVFSTYRKNIALVEKPYAIGLKVGLVKGF